MRKLKKKIKNIYPYSSLSKKVYINGHNFIMDNYKHIRTIGLIIVFIILMSCILIGLIR